MRPHSALPGDAWTVARDERGFRNRHLTLSQNPLLLNCPFGALQVKLRQHFCLVEDAPKAWHVSTLSYDYRINDGDGRELVS